MERYRDLKEMLHAELERIQTKGELDMSILEQADKLAHTLKDILTIEAMEDRDSRGYEERSHGSRYRDMGRFSDRRDYDDYRR